MSGKQAQQRATGGIDTTGLARALSKLGFCSRSQGWEIVKAGRVKVNGVVRRDPEWRVAWERERLEVDGQPVRADKKTYLMLNKPRGLVTTAADEQSRPTVFACLADATLPKVMPVGRLDMASEGLLLFTNDHDWANRVTAPASHVAKTYHVQVDCLPDEVLLQRLRSGVEADGELLKVREARVLRQGEKNGWLELVLDEGKNRQIRRLLEALGVNVLRLIRVAIGPLQLGPLAKGKWRLLTADEVKKIA